MMFVAPTSWWPWSLLVWFVGFIALERAIHALARTWRGKPLPGGPAGVAVSIAVAIYASSGDGDGAGDGGGGDGGGDGGGGGD